MFPPPRCTKREPKERPSIPTILTHLTSLLPEPPEEEQQEQEELSHTDSLGHVFLSIGEEDVDILEFLRVRTNHQGEGGGMGSEKRGWEYAGVKGIACRGKP